MNARSRVAALVVLTFVTVLHEEVTAQPPPPPRIAPQRPALWTFADIKAEAVSPTSARIAWQTRSGATHYVVHRDGAALIELPAATLAFVDESLKPGQTARYHVDAIAKAAPVKGPRVVNGPIALATATTLETSRQATVVTPALDAPREFGVAVTDAKARNVRLQWRAPQGATSIEVVRDGAVIARLPGTAATYDDVAVPAGSHRWSLRSVRASFTSAPSAALELRLRPFTILAAGDSIMWGQGLADGNKFTVLTRASLRGALKTEVELVSFAHSGAILRNTAAMPAARQEEPTGFAQARLVTPGEMPNTFPTILHQINVQAPAAVNGADVDLVLMDGCINDVGVTQILDPGKTPNDIRLVTQSKCSVMADVARRAHALFPNAAIVVTGYYAIVSLQSGASALPGFFAKIQLNAKPEGLVGRAAANSASFESASNSALAAAAATVNAEARMPDLVTFVPAPYGPQNAFAAPSTWLWHIPDAGNPDEVFAARDALCSSGAIATSIGFPVYQPTGGELAAARAKCPVAAMGHPNRAGAQAYANAIVAAIQKHLPRWRDRYAQSRREEAR